MLAWIYMKWPWACLSDITKVINGTTPKSTVSEYWGGRIIWLTPADMGKLESNDVVNSQRKITQAGFNSCGLSLVPPGSVILSSRAPIGHLAVAKTELCFNQGCKGLVPSKRVRTDYLYYAMRAFMEELKKRGSGATFSEVSKSQVESFEIPLPPLPEQQRIAAILTEQLAAVERARRASAARLEAARALPAAWLREAFEGLGVYDSNPQRIADIAELLPSKSIASDGDAQVLAVTTACLSEAGFRPEGIKNARMLTKDADVSALQPREILIARSNTPDLVGRASIYQGEPAGIVAPDLTIRIWPKEREIEGRFLSFFLTYLFQTGYWKNHAGGASGTMKKITRRQVLEKEIPVPPRAIQIDSVNWLQAQFDIFPNILSPLKFEAERLDSLADSLLRQAFTRIR